MENRLRRFPKARTLALSAATLTLFWLPGTAQTQSAPQQGGQVIPNDQGGQALPNDQGRQGVPDNQGGGALRDDDQGRQGAPDDDAHRGLARFDQFLDSHHAVADQVRRDPSLLDNRDFLQNHQDLDAFLRNNPGIRDQIRQDPNAFMHRADLENRDLNRRDFDGGRQDRDADRGRFDRFLDSHREIGDQVRKNPSLVNDRAFVQSHPALDSFLRDNPGVRDQLRQDPNAFMHRTDFDNRGDNGNFDRRDADGGRPDRDADRRDAMRLDRFLDSHREIADQVRKDPSLLDNRTFVQSHPALDSFLRDNPGVRDQLRQDPNAFMRQADLDNHDFDRRNSDPMRNHMADFGGFLGNHPDVRRDLARNPDSVKDDQYMHSHSDLDAYLNAHPDVRGDLMADPQSFVHGAQQYTNKTGTASGAGISGRGAGTTGTTGTTGTAGAAGTTGTSTDATHVPKLNH